MWEAKMKGIIFNIQRFSLHDGPGIRTLIFTKGCPLRCKWCSNPEGLSEKIEILNNDRKCIDCGICIKTCPQNAIFKKAPFSYPIHRLHCTVCGICVKHCPSNAKSFCGEEKDALDIFEKIKRDMPFYENGKGGVTIGGGELLTQVDFSLRLLSLCKKEGINTAIETSGHGKKIDLMKIAFQADTIFFDLKAINSSFHQDITGKTNKKILRNLIHLDHQIRKISPRPTLVIRVPLIGGYNATEANVRDIAKFIKEHLKSCSYVELLSFHNFGESKYEQLGLDYPLQGRKNGSSKDLTPFGNLMKDCGVPIKIS